MSQPENLKSLLESVANGTISPDTAFESLKDLAYESVGEFAKIDHHRHLRTGFPEVIWGPGKTPEQIAQIMEVMRHRTSVVMATRIQPDVYSILQKKVRGLQYFELARICAIIPHEIQPRFPGEIGIVSAGTADLPVAEEAAMTAQLYGFRVQRLWDVGVAGIHRLLNNRHLLNSASVLIVVAGMEGALPSVVAGLADCPVIAVPTSIGYGA
ncbi:MAG: nickel pincer cofactor biosynthesis protein LarB, partial [Sphaerospermopsis kisseleviana]